MKRTLSLIAASTLVALSFNSLAGGTHSGGHGHGSEESAMYSKQGKPHDQC
jgi:uncharacterized RmlC-like cupin family protein